MASTATAPILPNSVDALGLSTVTSVRSPTDPRPGASWDNTVMAAAVPIHFHPMTGPALGGVSVMMLSSVRWHNATPAATNPGRYSSYTSVTTPSWLLVNAANGHTNAVNSGVTIPITTTGTSPVLTGAVSRGVDMLYTLMSLTSGGSSQALIQQWHNNTAINTLNHINEELIPKGTNGADGVVFCAGVHYSAATDPYMYVYGTGSVTNDLYVARKSWSRIGATGTSTKPIDSAWEVATATGWDSDFTKAKPIPGLSSYGPVSVANCSIPRAMFGKTTSYTFISTTQKSGSAMSAQFYSSLGGRPWQALGDPISLGTYGSTYLGATAQLQPQLGPNPALVSSTAAAAIPYVTAVKNTSGGSDQILTTWNLLSVPTVN